MRKQTPRDIIAGLLEREVVSEQRQFLDALKEAGHGCAQATLSRLLKKMGVRKLAGVYEIGGEAPPLSQVEGWMQGVEVRMCPPNLVIVKTAPGHANAVAAKIDDWIQEAGEGSEKVEGTIAGDDTIFVAVRAGFDVGTLEALLTGKLINTSRPEKPSAHIQVIARRRAGRRA